MDALSSNNSGCRPWRPALPSAAGRRAVPADDRGQCREVRDDLDPRRTRGIADQRISALPTRLESLSSHDVSQIVSPHDGTRPAESRKPTGWPSRREQHDQPVGDGEQALQRNLQQTRIHPVARPGAAQHPAARRRSSAASAPIARRDAVQNSTASEPSRNTATPTTIASPVSGLLPSATAPDRGHLHRHLAAVPAHPDAAATRASARRTSRPH